jgi:hypothetical protein
MNAGHVVRALFAGAGALLVVAVFAPHVGPLEGFLGSLGIGLIAVAIMPRQ